MAGKQKDIAGLPPVRFVGRRVRLINPHGGHLRPASLVEVASKFRVRVRPDGHRGTETVTLDKVHPWWSQNPDLKLEHDALVENGAAAPVGDEHEVITPPPEHVAPPETIDEQEEVSTPPAEETYEDLLPPMPAISIEAGSDPTAWVDSMTKLREAIYEEQELHQKLSVIIARKRGAIDDLKAMGVTVTGDTGAA